MSSKNFVQSCKYAVAGILYCLRSQRNIKIQAGAACLALAAAWHFQLSPVEWMLLVLTIAVVMAAEMINTALETVVDLVSPDYNLLAKIAKDAAAGAVLVMAVMSVVVGYLLFFHRVFY